MKLLEFITKESDAPKGRIMLMAAISGLANGLLLAVINIAAEQVSNQTEESRLFLFYLTAFVLFIYTQKYALAQATIAIEEVISKVRLRIADKIRCSELRVIEETGTASMYTPLTQDSNLISQAAIILVMAGQSIIVLVVCSLYLAWLSPTSLLITLIFMGSAVVIYLSHSQKLSEELHLTSQKEAHFFDLFKHILEGFKELKINRRKSDDLFNYVKQVSNETNQLKVSTGLRIVTDMMYSQITVYLLLAMLVFIMPIFDPAHRDIIFKITVTILFIIGPLGQFVMAMPMIVKTNVAIENLYKLEAQLTEKEKQYTDFEETIPIPTFQVIQLVDVIFHYADKSGKALFSVGPINMSINQGEILFIIGGNGSGKSTLLKILISLYYPATGSVYLDDEIIDQTNYQSYRELFSIIFTDFHLFDRLYGLHDLEEARLKSLLRQMGLDKKTKYIDGQFTHLELSTGQKKRLALIAAILEDKPIYIFDELAADQDPHFRKYFYEVILQDLKKQGKTVIAVTHDDHYFHTADRVLKMEYGEVVATK